MKKFILVGLVCLTFAGCGRNPTPAEVQAENARQQSVNLALMAFKVTEINMSQIEIGQTNWMVAIVPYTNIISH